MPPKGKKGKKGAPVEAVPFYRRDLTRTAPLDGAGGTVGIEGMEMKRKIEESKAELVEWRVRACAEAGSFSVHVPHHDIHSLPPALLDFRLLQDLDLSFNFLVNDVFLALSVLPSLTSLSLRSNCLSGAVSDDIAKCIHLKTLNLDENTITSLPESLSELVEMETFSAKRNNLTELHPQWFRGWVNLRSLDVRENKLSRIPDEISLCMVLEHLLVGGNAIEVIPDRIGKLKMLTELQVFGNKLTSLPATLGHCSKLQLLHAGGNQIETLPVELCGCLTNLTELFLFKNALRELPPEISMLQNLTVLSCAGNSIASLPPDLGTLTQLKEVYLGGNPITELPEALSGWVNVEEVSFKGCKLKGIPLSLLAWAKCRRLDVKSGGKKDTCKIPPEFTLALPAMRIVGGVAAKKGKGKKK